MTTITFPLSQKLVQKQYCECLANNEFSWSQDLPHLDAVAGPGQPIAPVDILKSLKNMKNGKATGPPCVKIAADLMNAIVLK